MRDSLISVLRAAVDVPVPTKTQAHVPSRDVILMAAGCVLGTNVLTGYARARRERKTQARSDISMGRFAVVWIAHKRLRLHKLALLAWFGATTMIG